MIITSLSLTEYGVRSTEYVVLCIIRIKQSLRAWNKKLQHSTAPRLCFLDYCALRLEIILTLSR